MIGQGIPTDGAGPTEDEIRREMAGLGPRPETPARKPSRPNRRGYEQRSPAPKRPAAPPMPSAVAQAWYDTGNERGWEFPYDVNFLALAISARIEKDDFLTRLVEKQGEQQAERLLLKMVAVWWRDFVNGEVNRRNAKDYFLDEDWDEVRYYSHTSLRAAYLKVHGEHRPLKALSDEGDFGRDLHDRLKALRLQQQVEEILAEPEVTREPLDEQARERLRSFRTRHGGKK